MSAKTTSAGSDRVILKVGDVQVTEAEFESRISDIEPQGGDPDKDSVTEKDRRKLGDDYASVLMLSQQAACQSPRLLARGQPPVSHRPHAGAVRR